MPQEAASAGRVSGRMRMSVIVGSGGIRGCAVAKGNRPCVVLLVDVKRGVIRKLDRLGWWQVQTVNERMAARGSSLRWMYRGEFLDWVDGLS